MKPEEFQNNFANLAQAVGRAVIGYKETISHLLMGLFSGGNILLDAPPGLGKTLIGKTLAQALHIDYARIQFTPDLMPADIVGTNIIVEDAEGRKEFIFQKGPVFTSLLMADEINRATPKTQSALLEAMQEHHVTVAGKTYPLHEPFLVVATQNPDDLEGTYRLPEAQIDRFLFRLVLTGLGDKDWIEMARRRTGTIKIDVPTVLDGVQVVEMQTALRRVKVSDAVCAKAARLITMSHPDSASAPELVKKYVRLGSSPRGLQAMILGAKARAIANGRDTASFEDVMAVAVPSLSHRMLLNFEGQADGIQTERIVQAIMEGQA